MVTQDFRHRSRYAHRGLRSSRVLGPIELRALIFFEGAMDNASGIAMMLDIARHYGAVPQARRPRTLVFLTTSDHHHGSVGIRSVRDNYDWSKVALIVNCEHPSQTLLYNLDAGLMTANEVSARRWYVGGSDALRSLVRSSFREFGSPPTTSRSSRRAESSRKST
jgi:hypothetical protein